MSDTPRKNFFRALPGVFKSALARKAKREGLVSADGTSIPMMAHIQQLRQHVVRALIWVVVFSLVCFGFMKPVISYLKRPYDLFLQTTPHGATQNLTSLSVFEVMTVNFKLCFFIGFAASLPFILFELWKFVSPALYPAEKKIGATLVFFSVALFYAGLAFSYYLIIPYFFQSALLWASTYATVMLTYESYFNTLTTMLLIFAAVFEVPVFLSLLGLAGLLPSRVLTKNRKIVFLGCFIVGAILAPPDALSLCLVALPMYGMVEISIVILKKIEKKRQLRA